MNAKKQKTNEQRTLDHLQKGFNRSKGLKHLIKAKDPIIFDIGANSGQSLIEFKSIWPNATVHSFEPQQECWEELEGRANHYKEGSVIVNRIGAGSIHNDALTFYTHDITKGQSGFHRINTNSVDSMNLSEPLSQNQKKQYEKTLNHKRTVPIMRLDQYMSERNIRSASLIKIDTQGYEPEVLEGLGEMLRNVDVILTELMFYDFYERQLSFSDIEKFLIQAGYRLYDISHISKNPMNGRTDWIDVIYLNQSLFQKKW